MNRIHFHSSQRCFGPRTRLQNFTTQAGSDWTKVKALLCPHGAEWILILSPHHEKHCQGLNHEGQQWREAWNWLSQLASVFNPIHLRSSQHCFGPRTKPQNFTSQAWYDWAKARAFLSLHGKENWLELDVARLSLQYHVCVFVRVGDAHKGVSALISELLFCYPDFCRIIELACRHSSDIGQF